MRTLRFIEPAKPILVDAPPDGEGWLHEIKFDGFRTQLVIENASVRAYTSSGADWTDRYGPIVAAAAALPCREAIIDGEVYLPDERGAADFAGLASAIKRHPDALIFVGFDLLRLDGEDLRSQPVEERRAKLAALLAAAPPNLAFSATLEVSGPEAFAAVEELGLEGIVSKRKGSRYKSGPTDAWLKTKCFTIEEFDLIGIDRTEKRGIPKALFARDGRYMGDAVIGLKAKEREVLWQFLREHAAPHPPIAGLRRHATWLPPGPRARVKHLRGEQKLRHATFVGFANP